MADVKWLKIVTDIFDDEKILLIEELPDRDSIIVIWFKLLCLAGKQNNNGVFIMNNRIAYTDEMFATIFRRPINTVRLALNTFEQYGMIEIIDNVVTIPNWEKHQNIEGMEKIREQNRIRKQNQRDRQKQLLLEENHVMSRDSHATDKEEDKEYIYAHSDCADCAFFEKIWKLYPNKKGKNRVSKKALKKINSIGEERMTAAVKAYTKEVEGTDVKFIMHGSTFFNGGYEDYLDIEQPTEKQNTYSIPRLGHDLR